MTWYSNLSPAPSPGPFYLTFFAVVWTPSTYGLFVSKFFIHFFQNFKGIPYIRYWSYQGIPYIRYWSYLCKVLLCHKQPLGEFTSHVRTQNMSENHCIVHCDSAMLTSANVLVLTFSTSHCKIQASTILMITIYKYHTQWITYSWI